MAASNDGGQLALDLLPHTHGGARNGAGRPAKKASTRGYIPHHTRPRHAGWKPVHVTLRVRKGIPSLRRQVLEKIVKRCLLSQREQLVARNAKHFQVVHFSIQADHVHLLVEAPDKRGIARGVAGLEVRIARRINKLLARKGRFWKERYHRHDLATPTATRNVLRYVLLNTQKHFRVVSTHAFADPFSSAPTFDGFARTASTIFDDPHIWPSVAPRTWLLRVGWRRKGLIDPIAPPRTLERAQESEAA